MFMCVGAWQPPYHHISCTLPDQSKKCNKKKQLADMYEIYIKHCDPNNELEKNI